MAWAGLRHVLNTKVSPGISSCTDRFDTLDQLFDSASALEFKPDDNKPGGQQQQRQSGESQTGGHMKRNFQLSISEPMGNTSGNTNTSGNLNNSGTSNSKSGKSNKSSGGSHAHLLPAPWLLKEINKSRQSNRQCTHCSSSGDHITYLCAQYGKSSLPEQKASNNSGYDSKQIKCQSSFDTQQQQTSLPLSISNLT